MPDITFKLKVFQYDYTFSKSQNPALIAGWGSGKTLCLILRAMIYSEEIPNNLGVIFRKEAKDLEDSTILDFEKYTGRSVSKDARDIVFANGSRILFRHIEELSGASKRKGENIQNMNLGWFAIEQVEELPTDNEFFFLFGRLRRKVEPSKYFQELGLPLHSAFVVGNVYGDNWVRKLWKGKKDPDFELVEASTYDNAENLGEDFIKRLDILKAKKPDLYNRYVMNDWFAEIDSKVFKGIDRCIAGDFQKPIPGYRYIAGVDYAKTKDWFVITILCRETRHVVYFKRFQNNSWSYQKATVQAVSRFYNHALVKDDKTGVGDALDEDLSRAGVSVDGVVFTNRNKTEMVEKLMIAIENRHITYPRIDILLDELRAFQAIVLKSRKIRYEAPPGMTDDCVTALYLAVSDLDIYGGKKELEEPPEIWKKVKKDLQQIRIHRAEERPGLYKDVPEQDYVEVV